MESLPTRSRRFFARFFTILLILLLMAGIPAVYLLQQAKIDDLNRQNRELTTKVQRLEANTTPQQSPTPPPTPAVPSTTYQSPKGVTLTVTRPLANAVIASPVTVSGTVPGSWSFEGSFPVKILDANGVVIAQHAATLQGEWTTDDLVPFTISLTFAKPTTASGTIVLAKDNPSGLAQNDDSITIPIKFQ